MSTSNKIQEKSANPLTYSMSPSGSSANLNASNNSTSSAIMIQSPQMLQQRFSSNMCAVLNDPRKDRTKVNYLFTKTWGSDFVDSERLIPAIGHVHPANYANVSKKYDFKEYLSNMAEVILVNLMKKTSKSSLVFVFNFQVQAKKER